MTDKLWPSADAGTIRYNAQYEDGIDIVEELSGNRPDKDPYSYYYSIPKQMLTGVEYEYDIEDEATDIFRDYLKSVNYQFVDEYLENHYDSDRKFIFYNGEFLNLLDPLDRTLKTPLVDETIFVTEFVKHIQQTLLKEFPLWRLHIHGIYPENLVGLTIYPDVVVAGEKQSPPEDLDHLLLNWQKYISKYRENVRGPRRRQIFEIRQLLPKAIEILDLQLKHSESKPFVMIAAFDNWRGDESYISFWGLLSIKKMHTLFLCDSKLSVAVGDSFYLTTMGCFTKKYNEGNYELVQYIFKKQKSSNYELVMKEYKHEVNQDREPTGNEWVVHLNHTDIIPDSKLKRT